MKNAPKNPNPTTLDLFAAIFRATYPQAVATGTPGAATWTPAQCRASGLVLGALARAGYLTPQEQAQNAALIVAHTPRLVG